MVVMRFFFSLCLSLCVCRRMQKCNWFLLYVKNIWTWIRSIFNERKKNSKFFRLSVFNLKCIRTRCLFKFGQCARTTYVVEFNYQICFPPPPTNSERIRALTVNWPFPLLINWSQGIGNPHLKWFSINFTRPMKKIGFSIIFQKFICATDEW